MDENRAVVGPRVWRPPWIDVVVAAAFMLPTVAEAVLSPGVRSPVLHLVVAGLAMASLAWRRSFPLVVAVLVDAAVAVGEHMSATMWGAGAIALPGTVGFMAALPHRGARALACRPRALVGPAGGGRPGTGRSRVQQGVASE